VRGDWLPPRYEAADQNLSFKLCQMVADLFPDSSHVRAHELSEVADRVLWEFAKANSFAIVTQDVDFAEMAGLLGSPPKVIWLRTGNQTSAAIAALLRRHAKTILAFEGDGGTACLEIY
jgi:predicted nuclease of predicted toxin-antitoxin system